MESRATKPVAAGGRLEAYKVPPFPTAGVPTEAEWNDALSWAKGKGMLDVDVSYADSVTDTYLP